MEESKKMSRTELEQRLKAKGDAISGRFESIESSMPKKLPSLLSAAKASSTSKVVVAVGAGLLVGMILFRKKSSSKSVQYDDGVDRLSSQIAKRIADSLAKGADSDEAVKRALAEQPPLLSLSEETESLLSSALKQVLQTGVSMLGTELAEYLRNRKKSDHSE